MREIKFRAWDAGKKEWLCGYEMPNLGGFSLLGETVILGEWSKIIEEFIFERNGHKQDDLKIMQFTGLKDKNGKEIYERDIVKVREFIEQVVFIQGAWCTSEDGKTFNVKLYSWPSSMIEVIGNIYENKDLLK